MSSPAKRARLAICLSAIASGALLAIGEPVSARPRSSPERIARAIAPDNSYAQRFVLKYAERVADRVGNLDLYADLVEGNRSEIYNLLCERKVTGAFFPSERAGPSDLVRYVFSSTCYGVLPDARRKGEALEDLNKVLGDTRSFFAEAEVGNLAVEDRSEFRRVLGDAIKDYTGSDGIRGPEPYPKSIRNRYPWVVALWSASYQGGPAITNVLPPRWPKALEAAAFEACEAARIANIEKRDLSTSSRK